MALFNKIKKAAGLDRTEGVWGEMKEIGDNALKINLDNMKTALKEMIPQLDQYLDEEPWNFRRLMRAYALNNGNALDYTNKGMAIWYLLKRSWKYNFEYFVMLRMALCILKDRGIDTVNMYSFGCGSCLDSLSLGFALDNLAKNVFYAEYTGIDSRKWPVMFEVPEDLRPEEGEPFIQCGIEDFWNGRESFDGNLLFFPKVLGEIDEESDAVDKFADGLAKVKLTQDKIILGISYRSRNDFASGVTEPEWVKAQKIIDALLAQGYECNMKHELVPFDIDGLVRNDVIVALSTVQYPYYYFTFEGDDLQIVEVLPNFAPPMAFFEYMDEPGPVRRHCNFYEEREQRYLKMLPSADGKRPDPSTVCPFTCNIKCKTTPETTISSPEGMMCFQVLEFTR